MSDNDSSPTAAAGGDAVDVGEMERRAKEHGTLGVVLRPGEVLALVERVRAAEAERDALRKQLDVPDGEEVYVPASFAAMMDNVRHHMPGYASDSVENVVGYHIRQRKMAEAERDALRRAVEIRERQLCAAIAGIGQREADVYVVIGNDGLVYDVAKQGRVSTSCHTTPDYKLAPIAALAPAARGAGTRGEPGAGEGKAI
jgi:hypothetical protein